MATIRQKKAIENVMENHGNVSKAMRDAGYPAITAKNPKNLTESKAWELLMKKQLKDTLVVERHTQLLNSHTLDHMVFPLGPKEDGDEEDGAEHTTMTDDEIEELLKGVNCVVRKIVHGQQARHVYFWSPDNRARKDAIDLAYKVKNKYPRDSAKAIAAVQVNIGPVADNIDQMAEEIALRLQQQKIHEPSNQGTIS